MGNIDIIALLLTIIAVFVAIFIFRRVLIWVALIIILAVIGYFILQNKTGSSTRPTQASGKQNYVGLIEKFKDNYCGLLYDKDDSMMCSIIIQPIYNDIVTTYNQKQLSRMNKVELTKIIVQTAYKHKKEILRKLKSHNAIYLWEDFTYDIKNSRLYQ